MYQILCTKLSRRSYVLGFRYVGYHGFRHRIVYQLFYEYIYVSTEVCRSLKILEGGTRTFTELVSYASTEGV